MPRWWNNGDDLLLYPENMIIKYHQSPYQTTIIENILKHARIKWK